MKVASRRLVRLGKHHISSIHEKASKIQTAVWPQAIYGAESQLLGDNHFVKLRRQATEALALIGHHKFASSYLALHILFDRVDDPLLFVISTALCSLRRLFHHHPTLAQNMWREVLTSTTSQGQCGALAGYLRRVKWVPKPDGIVEMPSGHHSCPGFVAGPIDTRKTPCQQFISRSHTAKE